MKTKSNPSLYALLIWNVLLTAYLVYTHVYTDNTTVTERLDIVSKDQIPLLSLSNADLFPDPIIDGKTHKRAVSPSGMVFFNEDGNEVGGMAFSTRDSTSLNAFVLDYSNADAIGMLVHEDKGSGSHRAAIQINDKGETPGAGTHRISLQNENGTAGLFIMDRKGQVVVELSVDSLGKPKLLLPQITQ
ncbi:MAG TPA: hypothetical protein VNQ80_17120 [Parapedobacter sp.]|uniref:hypothetical protein n=1 Tax=Parapedobacter sp. TaxID=1958893 RepID=UPI002C480ECE|nr:hypothetical protein [Parapedobacter sp.]HWK59069.1 hypothetical protein [Parapedobacter sp.]